MLYLINFYTIFIFFLKGTYWFGILEMMILLHLHMYVHMAIMYLKYIGDRDQ